jgi:hypothetical protein
MDTLLTHQIERSVRGESRAAGRADPWESRRLWSLAEMLKVYADQYINR